MKNSLEKIKDADKQECLVRQFKAIIASYLWFYFLKKIYFWFIHKYFCIQHFMFLIISGLIPRMLQEEGGETLKLLLQQGEGLLSSAGIHMNNHTSTEVSFLSVTASKNWRKKN